MSSGFVAGTLVHTDKGLIPIQNLQVGDLVLSMPQNSLIDEMVDTNTSYRPIIHIYKSDKKQPIHSMLCTDEQPFWIKSHGWLISGQLSGWMRAFDLTKGYFQPNKFNYYDYNSENKSFLLETPFEKIAVAFYTVYDTRNESWWDNEPYVIDFNKESKNGIFPFEAHPKSSAGEDWWVTQGFEITPNDRDKYLKAIKSKDSLVYNSSVC